MANYDVGTRPPFNPSIRKFATTDKVHANVFNQTIEPIVKNEVALKDAVDDLSTVYMAAEEGATYYRGNYLIYQGGLYFCIAETSEAPSEESTAWVFLASVYGLQTTQSSAVTNPGTYCVDAVELNSTVEGTLANKVSQNSTNITQLSEKIVISDTDIGEGTSVEYPDGTLIFCNE